MRKVIKSKYLVLVSDVDRLIDVLQEPHMVEKPLDTDDLRLSRSISRSMRCVSERSRSNPESRRTSPGLEKEASTPKSRAMTEIVHSMPEIPGQARVRYSNTPIKSIRMSDFHSESSSATEDPLYTGSRVTFEIPEDHAQQQNPLTSDHLRVLVAEDDPINSRIVQKRLEKIGHEVFLTVNGEDCSSAYGERSSSFDVVLMDMQVSFSISIRTWSVLT